MVMLPCAMAQLEIWMLAVATMVPVRSLMMMRAGVSGVTSMSSSRAMKSTGAASAPSGNCTRIVVESTAWALLVNTSLTAVASREAEVKSGLRSSNSKLLSCTIVVGISLSTSAPPMMVAVVGLFFVTVAPPAPPAPAVNPPTRIGPWATA